MRKSALLSGMLAGSLLLSPTVLAETNQTESAIQKKETAVTIQELPGPVKKTVDKLIAYKPELKQIPAEIEKRKDPLLSQEKYSLSFTKNELRVSAEIGVDGTLLGFHMYNSDEKSEKRPSDALAEEKATAFLKQVVGNENEYRISHIRDGGYMAIEHDGKEKVTAYASVIILPLVNGIPLAGSHSIQVDINQEGQVTNWFNHDGNLDKSAFPNPENLISRETAEQAFLRAINMELVYDEEEGATRGPNGPENVNPVLKYRMTAKQIEAVTGNPIEDDYKEYTETKPVNGEAKVLRITSAKEAEKLLQTELGIQVNGLRFREEGDGVKQAKLYEWTTENNTVYAVQTTDKGEVLQFGCLSVHNAEKFKETGTISEEAAAAKALDFIKKYLPANVKEVQISYRGRSAYPDWVDESKIPSNNVLLVGFTEMKDEIPITNRAIHAWIDLATGKIEQVSLYIPLQSVLPDSSKKIDRDKAASIYLESHPLQLQYVWPHMLDQKAKKPMLVYAPLDDYYVEYIDALSGKVVTSR